MLLCVAANRGNLAHRRTRIPEPRKNELEPTNPHLRVRPPDASVGIGKETVRRSKFRKIAPVVNGGRGDDFRRVHIINDGLRALR